jgi:hypothetical protein
LIDAHWLGNGSKVLASLVVQSGGESYELKLSVGIGLLGTIVCFLLLEHADGVLDFGINSGMHVVDSASVRAHANRCLLFGLLLLQDIWICAKHGYESSNHAQISRK